MDGVDHMESAAGDDDSRYLGDLADAGCNPGCMAACVGGDGYPHVYQVGFHGDRGPEIGCSCCRLCVRV